MIVLLPIAVAGFVIITRYFRDEAAKQKLTDIESKIARGNASEVLTQLQELAEKEQLDSARVVWGEVLVRSRELDNALNTLKVVNPLKLAPTWRRRWGLALGEANYQLGHLGNAMDVADIACAADSQSLAAVELWVTAASLASLRWETIPGLHKLLDAAQYRRESLTLLANQEALPPPATEHFSRIFKSHDSYSQLCAARMLRDLQRSPQALESLEKSLQGRPDVPTALALLGELIIENGDRRVYAAWLKRVPPSAEKHPGVAAVRAAWHAARNEQILANREHLNVVLQHSDSIRATQGLGIGLRSLGMTAEAEVLLNRSEKLAELAHLAVRLIQGRGSIDTLRQARAITSALGRGREAYYWNELILDEIADDADARAARNRLELEREQLQDPEFLELLRRLDERWDTLVGPSKELAPVVMGQETVEIVRPVEFRDDADSAGLTFQFNNGSPAGTREACRIFAPLGGGVGILDFDRDGWPDVYFCQGADWPLKSTANRLDSLQRNLSGQRFAAIEANAGIAEERFSQGVACGDFDNDGFPDVYAATLQGTRLFQNCGDGSFQEMTHLLGDGNERWTTSVAMADLNLDSRPDLFDVTYMAGPTSEWERVCHDADLPDLHKSCAPVTYEPATDRFLQATDELGFVDRSAEAMIDVGGGDGLGLIVAGFSPGAAPSLFVANDGRANFLFQPMADAPEAEIRYLERGRDAGLAFDENGSPQASMGVAAADFSGDGLLDLLVTNFYNEANAYYRNLGGDVFQEAARLHGLFAPSRTRLGFGAQPVDADHDGHMDLLLLNGHVDNLERQRIPYRMAPHFYRNTGGRFSLATSSELGPYFDMPQLGRALATVDWNRDGRLDAVASHLDSPAALLTNTSPSVGHWMILRFVGTSCSRDAYTVQCAIKNGNEKRTYQLVAGSGYMASNEPLIHIGLAAATRLDALEVTWPGGGVQNFEGVLADRAYVVVEHRQKLVELPRE